MVWYWFSEPVSMEIYHATRITDDAMTLQTVDRIVAAAGFRQHTAAGGWNARATNKGSGAYGIPQA